MRPYIVRIASDNVLEFKKDDCLPVTVKFDIKNITLDTLIVKNAKLKWHNSCHLKFCKFKVEKAKERRNNRVKADQQQQVVDRGMKRALKADSSVKNEKCVVCNEDDGGHVQFLDVGSRT